MQFTQTSASRPVRNLGYVDAMRGLGVLGVFLDHVGHQSGMIERWKTVLSDSGDFGVQLFYVASAFTLFLSLDGRKTEPSPTRNFFLRRFFRIAPVFYLAMLVTLVLNVLHVRFAMTEPTHRDLLLGFFFLHGFSPTGINTVTAGAWSIADECLFYAMLPWLYPRVRNLTGCVVALGAAIAVNRVANFCFYHSFPSQGQYLVWWFPTELPVFMMGIVAYYLWKSLLHSGAHRPASARLLSLALLGTAAGIFGFVHRFFPLLHGVAAIAVLLGVMLHPWAVLVNRATRFLGKISYSMYLLHFFVIVLISEALRKSVAAGHSVWQERLFGTPLGFVVYLAVLLCLSAPLCTASWLFLEEPLIALGRGLIARLDHTRQQNPAPPLPGPHDLVSASNTSDNQF